MLSLWLTVIGQRRRWGRGGWWGWWAGRGNDAFFVVGWERWFGGGKCCWSGVLLRGFLRFVSVGQIIISTTINFLRKLHRNDEKSFLKEGIVVLVFTGITKSCEVRRQAGVQKVEYNERYFYPPDYSLSRKSKRRSTRATIKKWTRFHNHTKK